MSKEPTRKLPQIFYLLWIGQSIATFTSALVEFSAAVWVFEQRRSVDEYSTLLLCVMLPGVLVVPLGGLMADRWSRRTVMMISDLGAGIMPIILWALLVRQQLTPLLLWVVIALTSLFSSLKQPAFLGAIGQVLTPTQLGRANGLIQTSQSLIQLSQMTAGFLVASIGFSGVLLLNVVGLALSVVSLALAKLPPVQQLLGARPSFKNELVGGWSFMIAHGWLAALFFFDFASSSAGSLSDIFTPALLQVSTVTRLGIALGASSAASLLGGLLLASTGGGRNRVRSMMLATALAIGALLLMAATNSVWVLMIGFAVFHFAGPIVQGLEQSLIQVNVPAEIQGRVFGLFGGFTVLTRAGWLLLVGKISDSAFQHFGDYSIIFFAAGVILFVFSLGVFSNTDLRTRGKPPVEA